MESKITKFSTVYSIEDKAKEIRIFVEGSKIAYKKFNIICNSQDGIEDYLRDLSNLLEFTYVDKNFKRYGKMSSNSYHDHLQYCVDNNQPPIILNEFRDLSLSDNGYKEGRSYGGRWSNFMQVTISFDHKLHSLHFIDKEYLQKLFTNPDRVEERKKIYSFGGSNCWKQDGTPVNKMFIKLIREFMRDNRQTTMFDFDGELTFSEKDSEYVYLRRAKDCYLLDYSKEVNQINPYEEIRPIGDLGTDPIEYGSDLIKEIEKVDTYNINTFLHSIDETYTPWDPNSNSYDPRNVMAFKFMKSKLNKMSRKELREFLQWRIPLIQYIRNLHLRSGVDIPILFHMIATKVSREQNWIHLKSPMYTGEYDYPMITSYDMKEYRITPEIEFNGSTWRFNGKYRYVPLDTMPGDGYVTSGFTFSKTHELIDKRNQEQNGNTN